MTQILQHWSRLRRIASTVLNSLWDFLVISLFVQGQHGPMERLVAEFLMLYQFTVVNFVILPRVFEDLSPYFRRFLRMEARFLYMLEKKISYAIGLGIQGGFMQWSGQVKRSLEQLLMSHFW